MICIASGSICGLFGSDGIVGSTYLIVTAAKWAITCVSGKGPIYGVRFWYQFFSGTVSIAVVLWSFLAASLAQCIACWTISSLCGWA